MSERVMKENIEDNTTRSSLAGSVVVHWKWNQERDQREFIDMRLGGDTETQYDLDLKYDENSLENESVLISSEQMGQDSTQVKKEKIYDLLISDDWLWSPEQKTDFKKEINKIVKE